MFVVWQEENAQLVDPGGVGFDQFKFEMFYMAWQKKCYWCENRRWKPLKANLAPKYRLHKMNEFQQCQLRVGLRCLERNLYGGTY